MNRKHEYEVSEKELDRLKRGFWREALMIMLTLIASFFALISSFLTKTKATQLLRSDVTLRLLIVLAGILLLGLIIASIAGLIKRKNREVILLKKHVAQIYLSALRKSSLNPSVETTISHE